VHIAPELTLAQKTLPLAIAGALVAAFSLLKEPQRRTCSALVIAGAGATYLAGGLGPWELILPVLMTPLAYFGLKDYRFIGAGWLLHVAWDLVHHFYGNPILPFNPTSSAGCAICDTVLAAWYFVGAPSIFRIGNKPATAA
jgi:hypothetical protein